MNRNFIRKNITGFSILVFLFLFVVIMVTKPSFVYTKEGAIRDFGMGYKNRTIFPMWLVTIVIAILSYFIIMFYLGYPKFM